MSLEPGKTYASAVTQMAFTENGAVAIPLPEPAATKKTGFGVTFNSFPDRKEGRVGLFFHTVRGIQPNKLRKLVVTSLEEDVEDTIKIMFHCRDGVRGKGKGEKEVFYSMWNIVTDLGFGDLLLCNVGLVPFYGSYKDLLQICVKCQNECTTSYIVNYYAESLSLLWSSIEEEDGVIIGMEKNIGLAAKWAPSEKKSFDKKMKLGKQIRKRLNWSSQEYRQRLSTMRKRKIGKVYVVEKQMCRKRFDIIPYDRVPGRAFKQYMNAFKRHDLKRFTKHMEEMKKELEQPGSTEKKKTLKTKALMPHEIYRDIIHHRSEEYELLWKTKLEEVKKKFGDDIKNTICVADVSGSMSGLPMDVSTSLSVFLSQLVSGKFYGHIITFTESPQFHMVSDKDSLQDTFNKVRSCPWGMSTNIQAVFDLILSTAKDYKLTEKDMPDQILILSDMEFNQAAPGKTNFETIKEKYKRSGFEMPRLVFWNLRSSSTTYSVPAGVQETNVSMVSGFNPSMLDAVIYAKTPDPYTVMRHAIDNERYQKLRFPNF